MSSSKQAHTVAVLLNVDGEDEPSRFRLTGFLTTDEAEEIACKHYADSGYSATVLVSYVE